MRRIAHECAIRRNALAAFAYLASLPRPPRPGGAWPGIWLRAGVAASGRAGWLEIRKNPQRIGQEANPVDMEVTYRGTVYPWHCDHMGHMNVMWYVGKFDEATWQLFSSIGLPPKPLRNEGIGMVAVEQRLEYKQELVAGDLLTVRSS